MTKTDRRVQRTRDLLQQALISLMSERDYESITIQDIVDRANLGRTTFYLHYQSKDDLFLHCHDMMVRVFDLGPHAMRSRSDFLTLETPHGMRRAYRHLEEMRSRIAPLFQRNDGLVLLRHLRDRLSHQLAECLRKTFDDAEGVIPIDVLAAYLAGAQLSLIHWWLKQRQPYSAEVLAQTIHRMQRAAIRDAFGIQNGEEGHENVHA